MLKTRREPVKEAIASNESLNRFTYLETLQTERTDLVSFAIEELKNDVTTGMYFDSSIPQGYGVGSEWRFSSCYL
jgi:mevalonate kinase